MLQNREGYGVSTTFLGEFKNNGAVSVSGGSFSLYLEKGLDNTGNYRPTNTYLQGKSPRTIKTISQSLLEGKVIATDTFTLLSENFLPHLQVNGSGFVTVDTAASLSVLEYYNGNDDNSIRNLNTISVKKPIANYYDKYYRAKAYFKQYNNFGDLEVETYCNQQHPAT